MKINKSPGYYGRRIQAVDRDAGVYLEVVYFSEYFSSSIYVGKNLNSVFRVPVCKKTAQLLFPLKEELRRRSYETD